MQNIFDKRPESVFFKGKEYPLNLSFDRVLLAFDAQECEEILPREKITLQIELLVDCRVSLDEKEQTELLNCIFSLFPRGNSKEIKTIDFHQDASLIRSAFFRAYKIDLTTEKIHWFQFIELLADLPSDTALMQVISIRKKPMPKPTKYNREEIAELQKAKSKVAIKIPEHQREAAFANSLKNALKSMQG